MVALMFNELILQAVHIFYQSSCHPFPFFLFIDMLNIPRHILKKNSLYAKKDIGPCQISMTEHFAEKANG